MTLVLLDNGEGEREVGEGAGAPRIVCRVPQGEARREDVLRDLLFAHPQILPIAEIDPALGPLVPVARELTIPDVGRIDAFFVDPRGQLVIVECKLWRNPQARREVVGQILDYARELARFSYDDLQREVSRATGESGNALYRLVAAHGEAGAAALDEARFVDQVSRNLAAGRFLLLVVGDGITEGTQRIGEYLTAQPGLAFTFALVEMTQYRVPGREGGAEQVIVQPRLLARTVLIERAVIRNEARVVIEDLREDTLAPAGEAGGGRKLDSGLQQAWRGFAERFLAQLAFDDPAQPPPRIGGLGWLKARLPRGHWLTLYRSTGSGNVGAYANLVGADGRTVYARLIADRPAIDEEFADAGLPAPNWSESDKGGTIGLKWPSPLPWDGQSEAEQTMLLSRAANQLVNSLRPRLDRIDGEL